MFATVPLGGNASKSFWEKRVFQVEYLSCAFFVTIIFNHKGPLFSNDIKECHFCSAYLMVVKL